MSNHSGIICFQKFCHVTLAQKRLNDRFPMVVFLINEGAMNPGFHTGGQDKPLYSAQFYDMKTDSHFPWFFGAGVQCETTRRFPRNVVEVVRKTNFENTVILRWVHGCTPTDLSYFYTQYNDTFRTWKDVFAKHRVSIQEIWRKFKCREIMSCSPPPPPRFHTFQQRRWNCLRPKCCHTVWWWIFSVYNG